MREHKTSRFGSGSRTEHGTRASGLYPAESSRSQHDQSIYLRSSDDTRHFEPDYGELHTTLQAMKLTHHTPNADSVMRHYKEGKHQRGSGYATVKLVTPTAMATEQARGQMKKPKVTRKRGRGVVKKRRRRRRGKPTQKKRKTIKRTVKTKRRQTGVRKRRDNFKF